MCESWRFWYARKMMPRERMAMMTDPMTGLILRLVSEGRGGSTRQHLEKISCIGLNRRRQPVVLPLTRTP
jgi:hypothetical protein